jgi:hypothetical protein
VRLPNPEVHDYVGSVSNEMTLELRWVVMLDSNELRAAKTPSRWVNVNSGHFDKPRITFK